VGFFGFGAGSGSGIGSSKLKNDIVRYALEVQQRNI